MQLPTFFLCSICLCAFHANAQITFSSSDLPSRIGDYRRVFMDTNGVNVSAFTAPADGSQHWDFSHAQSSGEHIRRLDIVSPNDGGHGANFPQATYAHRFDMDENGTPIREYYRILPDQGRAQYGFSDSSAKVFDSPTIELPLPIQFGQTWNRAVNFEDGVYGVHFTAQVQVDAYGTLVLPVIGEVPALRVSALHQYQHSVFGIPYYLYYVRNYCWLVPGIGKAVEIISIPDDTGPPSANFTTARTTLRVFETSGLLQPPVAVSDLRIQLEGTQVRLDWQSETNASGYRIAFLSNLGTNAWEWVSDSFTNTWTETVGTNVHRFYRVVVKP